MHKPIQYFEKHWEGIFSDLQDVVRIPSVSFPGFPKEKVMECAEKVRSVFEEYGLENVCFLEVDGAPPYVYADWLHAEGKPTLLLYAHYDVQPPGRESVWRTEPFVPTIAEGPEGLRLFGRGSADDKAGIFVHLAAILSFLKTEGKLPVNVKLVIEGEEEVGSEHLADFLNTHRKKLDADVLVLTDTANLDCGVPALTTSLRGMVGVEVEVTALTKTIHSGLWGGPVPDPVMALSKALATLVDEKGNILIPEVQEALEPVTSEEERELKSIPFDESKFREQSGMIPEAEILQLGPSPIGQLWKFPSLTVTAIQASSRAQAGNIVNDTAWAKVTIRLTPGMDPKKIYSGLEKKLKGSIPWGLKVSIKGDFFSDPWKANQDGDYRKKAFELAMVALEKGYGAKAYQIGCGASIPFVKPFEEALSNAPVLMIGVEDPYTNAHGENESLLVGDFKKACMSQIYLFSELAKLR